MERDERLRTAEGWCTGYFDCDVVRAMPVGNDVSAPRHAGFTVVVRQNGRHCASRDGSLCTYWRQFGGLRSYDARAVLSRIVLE